jgi:hypothetical protein
MLPLTYTRQTHANLYDCTSYETKKRVRCELAVIAVEKVNQDNERNHFKRFMRHIRTSAMSIPISACSGNSSLRYCPALNRAVALLVVVHQDGKQEFVSMAMVVRTVANAGFARRD